MAMCVRLLLILFTHAVSLQLRHPGVELYSDIGPEPEEVVEHRRLVDGHLTLLVNEEIRNGFPSVKEDPRPVVDRLQSALQSGNAEPCKADLLMNGLNYPYGFGARAMMAVDELQVAIYFNMSVAICDGNAERTGVGWSRFFANPGFGFCGDATACSAGSNAAGWLGSTMSKGLRKDDGPLAHSIKHLLYNSLFDINVETGSSIARALQDAGLPKGKRYVGVHIRRGDKKASKNSPMSTYAKAVSEELASRALSDVFVASDDPHAGDELSRVLAPSHPGVRVIQMFSDTSKSRTYDSNDGTLALLTDVAALRDAEVFIGTHISYLSRFAYFLRELMSESKSLDGDWLRGNML